MEMHAGSSQRRRNHQLQRVRSTIARAQQRYLKAHGIAIKNSPKQIIKLVKDQKPTQTRRRHTQMQPTHSHSKAQLLPPRTFDKSRRVFSRRCTAEVSTSLLET